MSQSVKQPRQTTMYDHIRELQIRLGFSAIALAIAGTIVYLFYKPILTFLSSPLNAPLYYSNPAGGFAFVMKICFTGGLIFTIPIITYNLIMFVRPAFNKILSIKRVLITTVSSTLLSLSGAAFAFFVILPGCLVFFKGFQVSGLNALISADSYLGFVTNIIITFVIVFQIPLIITFIDIIKPLSPRTLIGWEKWVVIGSLIIALLTPFTYDFVTSILIAVPIIALYNLSILIVVFRHVSKKRQKQAVHKKPNGPQIDKDVDTELLMLLNEFAAENNETLSPPKIRPIYTGLEPNSQRSTVAAATSSTSEARKVRRAEPGKRVRLISDFK